MSGFIVSLSDDNDPVDVEDETFHLQFSTSGNDRNIVFFLQMAFMVFK